MTRKPMSATNENARFRVGDKLRNPTVVAYGETVQQAVEDLRDLGYQEEPAIICRPSKRLHIH